MDDREHRSEKRRKVQSDNDLVAEIASLKDLMTVHEATIQTQKLEIERLEGLVGSLQVKANSAATLEQERNNAQNECQNVRSKLEEKRETIKAQNGRIEELLDPKAAIEAAATAFVGEIQLKRAFFDKENVRNDVLEGTDGKSTPAMCLKALKEELPLAAQLFDMLFRKTHQTESSSSSTTLANERKDARHNLHHWLAFAHLATVKNPSWHSRLTYDISEEILASRHVSSAYETVSYLLPGSYSLVNLEDIQNKRFEKAVREFSLEIDPDKLYVHMHDNIQIKLARTALAGIKASRNNKMHVQTARSIVRFPCAQANEIRQNYDNHPQKMAEMFPLSSVPSTALDLSDTCDTDNEDDMSDKEYHTCEQLERIKLGIEYLKKQNFVSKVETRGAGFVPPAVPGAPIKGVEKKCQPCGEINYNRYRKCRSCGAELPTMEEMAMSEGTDLTVDTFAMPQAETKSRQTFYIPRALVSDRNGARRVDIGSESKGDEDSDAGAGELQDALPDTHASILPLPILDYNPGSNAARERTAKFASQILQVNNGGGMFGFMTGDLGVFNVKQLVSDDIQNICPVIGFGHGEMAVTRALMVIVEASLGPEFVFAHGFKQDGGGPKYLLKCTNNHYSWTFLQICCDAIVNEFIKVYLEEQEEQSRIEDLHTDDLAEKVLKWLGEDKEDLRFRNFVITFELLSAGMLLRKSLRDNDGKGNAFALEAAILFILPLLFMLNFENYARVFAWNLIRIRYRTSNEMKRVLRSMIAVNGEGLDFSMEMLIQQIMRSRRGRDPKGLRAACVRVMTKKGDRTAVCSSIGKAERKSTEHMPGDYSEELVQMDQLLRKVNFFTKVQDREIIMSADGTHKWKQNQSLDLLKQEGTKEMKRNQEKAFLKPLPKCADLIEGRDTAKNPLPLNVEEAPMLPNDEFYVGEHAAQALQGPAGEEGVE